MRGVEELLHLLEKGFNEQEARCKSSCVSFFCNGAGLVMHLGDKGVRGLQEALIQLGLKRLNSSLHMKMGENFGA